VTYLSGEAILAGPRIGDEVGGGKPPEGGGRVGLYEFDWLAGGKKKNAHPRHKKHGNSTFTPHHATLISHRQKSDMPRRLKSIQREKKK